MFFFLPFSHNVTRVYVNCIVFIIARSSFFFDKIKMISSNDCHTDTDNSLSTSSSFSLDTDDAIDLTKWTATPTVSRDPFRFVGSLEVQVKEAKIPITLILTHTLIYEFAKSFCKKFTG